MPWISKLNYAMCKKLADIRLTEAKHLFTNKQYSGAYYLSGYAIEMSLKAVYCGGVSRGSFPPNKQIYRDLYSHDLNALLRASEAKKDYDTEVSSNSQLAVDWNIVKEWSPETRYIKMKRKDAEPMVASAEKVLEWIKTIW